MGPTVDAEANDPNATTAAARSTTERAAFNDEAGARLARWCAAHRGLAIF
eukprot:CAMPEP_0198498666 /NCGR_PEP_ID=MMETSP1462-20131121/7148_1 /TAXON_ID=1333877 /ORGANISM="Brandtodinium nutriculum, Strain RCC3387" /LENGTH=49 /DNA_ID=CAMNT_0044227599 /DNA_START=1 /DNA_END=151 /DNA_ORIENTATION=-